MLITGQLLSLFSISALGGSSALHIPAFPSGGCLIDYVPQVCQLLTNKVNVLGVIHFTLHNVIRSALCQLFVTLNVRLFKTGQDSLLLVGMYVYE